MITDNTLVKVRNRNNGTTGYVLADQNIHRTWEVNEEKTIPFSELKACSYLPGGLYCLNNLLVIEDKEVLEMLNMQVEPEYFYTEEDVKDILFNGSYDEVADFLDFAPEGAIEIAKQIAVEEKLPDMNKRKMISEKTGLNITNAIMVNEVMDGDEEKEEKAPKQRRVNKTTEKKTESENKPTRRAEIPQYKVVNK